MKESDYYPAGAYSDPNAPYNEVDVPEKDFEITCSQSLSRTAIVTTNNYIPCVDEGCEDGVGYHDEWADTSDTCWSDEYANNGYKTPLELICLLREYVAKELTELENTMEPDDRSYKATQARMLRGLIEECDAWSEDETDFELG